jgi:hypothetical protein
MCSTLLYILIMALQQFPDTGPYVHQPFDDASKEIRLIHVRRGPNGIIHCDLRTFPIKGLPDFLALSYTWGAPTPMYKVMIDGEHLEVRENLYHFLDEFCDFPHEYIWIDQISINQIDVEERSQQVGLMAKIYRKAAYVVVWLGNDGRYRQAALDLNSDGEDDDVTKLKSVDLLLANDYFTRLWIVQEIVLAKEVRVMVRGNIWVPWSTMSFTAALSCGAGTDYSPAVLNLLQNNVTIIPHNFPLLVTFLGQNKCEDPRDKVYGLLGLVNGPVRITPNYDKSVQELHDEVVKIVSEDYEAMDGTPLIPLHHFKFMLGESLGLQNRPIETRAQEA